jgi:manganese transport protein
VIVTALSGERGVGSLLILSQVILSLQLSFAVVPLVLFTSQKGKMGQFVNSRPVAALAWVTTVVILGLNGWLLLTTARGWLA